MASMATLSRSETDFLYWHAVSKLRISMFDDAAVLFDLLQAVHPEWVDARLGLAYCQMRLGQLEEAHQGLEKARGRSVNSAAEPLVARLLRRCEFERGKGQGD